LLRAAAGIQVIHHYKSVMGARAKAKTMTTSRYTGLVVPRSGKQLTHIVRVSLSGFVIERQTPIFKHFSPDLEINLSGFLSEKSK